jgi:ribosome-binding protein aMBF1 (putative translation factor)
MASSFKKFKTQALARPEVRKAYDDLAEEFAFLDEVLKARAAAGLTQAEVAARVGTTQSAIAHLESRSASAFSVGCHPSTLCAGAGLSAGGASGERSEG